MIFISGASGFVGRHLIAELIKTKCKIRALILTGEKIPSIDAGIEWVEGDVRDRKTLAGYLSGVKTVVHLAGLVASSDEKLNHEVNFIGTKNLVDLGIQNKVNKFIFMSAAAAKFKNVNAYGATKKIAEKYVIDSGIPYAILRTPLIVGDGGYEYEKFVEYIKKIPGVVIVPGSGAAIKRPISIHDVVFSLKRLIDDDMLSGKVYEIASRDKISLDEFIDEISFSLGKKKAKVHIPLNVSLLLAGTLEKILGAKSPVTKDMLLGLNEDVDLDIENSLKEFDLIPLTLSESILRYPEKIQNN